MTTTTQMAIPKGKAELVKSFDALRKTAQTVATVDAKAAQAKAELSDAYRDLAATDAGKPSKLTFQTESKKGKRDHVFPTVLMGATVALTNWYREVAEKTTASDVPNILSADKYTNPALRCAIVALRNAGYSVALDPVTMSEKSKADTDDGKAAIYRAATLLVTPKTDAAKKPIKTKRGLDLLAELVGRVNEGERLTFVRKARAALAEIEADLNAIEGEGEAVEETPALPAPKAEPKAEPEGKVTLTITPQQRAILQGLLAG